MNSKVKNVLNILLKIASWLLIAFAVFMMVFTIVTVTTVDRNDRNMFGLRFYIVRTGSMSKSENNAHMDIHFDPGDIILIKKVKDPTALEVGDVIAFVSTNNDESYLSTVTHMIREVARTKDGELLGYYTYGTNTGAHDEALVEPEYVIGKYAGKLPRVGHFFAFVKTTPGYITCILIPFLLLILYNGVNVIRLFRKYKKEQTAIMEAERAEIQAERRQNEEMLRELQALKEQLAKQNGGNIPPPASENGTDASESDSENTEDNSETT